MQRNALQARLNEIGQLPDNDLPIAQTLLLMAAIERDDIDLQPFEAQIVAMQDALSVASAMPPKGDVLKFRSDCLNAIIYDEFGFRPDIDGYENTGNMNFITVMERRSGIPVALGVLYLELARKQNWPVFGLNFPGHFLVRLDDGAQRVILDPFDEGKIMQAPDLRGLLKKTMGADAELNHLYYEAVTARDVVLRFCNNRKTRLIQKEEYKAAMEIIMNEMSVAPNEPRLLFEAGMLCARLHQIQRGIAYMEEFTQRSSDKKSILEAQDVMRGLRRLLQ